MRDRTKTETRRLGWAKLRPGDYVRAVEKCMGLQKGEKVKPIGIIRVTSVTFEPLNYIGIHAVAREGYPGNTPAWFVAKFCKAMKCEPTRVVTVIRFEHVDSLAAHKQENDQ